MIEKTKILYIVSTLRQSGPTNQLRGIINNLDKKLFDIKVLTLAPEPSDTDMKKYLEDMIEVESLNLSRMQFQIIGKKSLANYIQRFSPNIIHTSGVRADTVVSKMNYSSKHCMTIRNYAFEDYISKFGKIIGSLAAKSNINAMKRCKYVVFCSESLRLMYDNILPQKLFVVQNGVDTIKFKPIEDRKSKSNLKRKLGIPDDKIVFIVVGSLIKRKDPMTIINAFNRSQNNSKAILLILGEGILMEQCSKYENENIILKGSVTNVEEYLKVSDYYISASASEGLPNSVLEAGSCGNNIILSNIPQHREIFNYQFSLVSLFKFGNTNELARIIQKEISEFTDGVNYSMSNYVVKYFSNKNMSKEYQLIYNGIIKNNQEKSIYER
ncbi:MAG: glycosyltransferase [Alkalibacterium sp.]|nr:glycosyltransferase [Alkalibacterium sp.]